MGTTSDVPSVTVEGWAHRHVMPDIAEVAVAIRTPRLATPQEALTEAIAARERLRERIGFRLAGVEVQDIRITARPEHAQQRRPQPMGPGFPGGGDEVEWVVVGYTGVGALTLRTETRRAAEVVMAVADHPDAAQVDPTFLLDRPTRRRVLDELECDALRDAHARAARLAGVLKRPLGPALSVKVGTDAGDGAMTYQRTALMMDASGGQEPEVSELRPEPLDIEARVTARFALETAAGAAAPSGDPHTGYA